MKFNELLKKEFSLPPFSLRSILIASASVLLSNIALLLLAWFTKTARPLVNTDYFFAILLLAYTLYFIQIFGDISILGSTGI